MNIHQAPGYSLLPHDLQLFGSLPPMKRCKSRKPTAGRPPWIIQRADHVLWWQGAAAVPHTPAQAPCRLKVSQKVSLRSRSWLRQRRLLAGCVASSIHEDCWASSASSCRNIRATLMAVMCTQAGVTRVLRHCIKLCSKRTAVQSCPGCWPAARQCLWGVLRKPGWGCATRSQGSIKMSHGWIGNCHPHGQALRLSDAHAL